MSRRKRRIPAPETGEFGSDSFLDVVTNVVGILIILVVVVGLRVQQAPATTGAVAGPPPDLAGPRAEAASLREDVRRLNEEVDQIEAETRSRFEERAALAYLVATGERQLAARRAELSAEAQQAYDLRRSLETATVELASLEAELTRVQGENTQPVEIETYPTPISSVVEGSESHFHLAGGLITPIPLDELLELCRDEAKSRMWKLQNQPSVTGVVGPVGGFRLRFVLERVEMAFEGGSRMSAYAQLSQWELEPTGTLPGETLEEAQQAGSQFRQTIARLTPHRATITLWTYPDSFALYRELKKELYHRGFATAGRPLPTGVPIGGSPDGSRSTAQ